MNINTSANLEAINHLAAALDSIRQQAARLSLLGRALTPLEQQRLQLPATRDYVRYGEGKFQLSKADPELANRWLESIRPLAKQVFDPQTAARLAIKKGKAK